MLLYFRKLSVKVVHVMCPWNNYANSTMNVKKNMNMYMNMNVNLNDGHGHKLSPCKDNDKIFLLSKK